MIPSFKAPDAPLARRHRGGAAVVFAYFDVPLESGAGSGGHYSCCPGKHREYRGRQSFGGKQYRRFFLCGRIPSVRPIVESGIATLRRKGGYLYRSPQ
jgi:hypothetical protein